jgi:hypothetical protein
MFYDAVAEHHACLISLEIRRYRRIAKTKYVSSKI